MFINLRATYPMIPAHIPLPDVELRPDMIWLLNRYGWSEAKNDAQLAQYAVYANLHWNTVRGVDHAWCAVIDAAAQSECGYDAPMTAAAAGAIGHSLKCELQVNCSAVIKHSSGPRIGHYHRTRPFSIDRVRGVFYGLGGNQGDEINIGEYPIGDVVYCFMPQLKPTNPQEPVNE